MYLFTGHRDHKVDGKDRIVIPTAFASAIATHGEAALFLVPGSEGRFVEAYPADVFRSIASGQVPSRFEGDQATKRAFYQNAERVELNGPGRITLPKRFLPHFPTGVVRICGMNTYLELWDPELWEKHVAGTREGRSTGETGGGSRAPRH